MIKLIATDIDGTLLKDGTLMIDPAPVDSLSVSVSFLLPSGISFSISRTGAR